MLAEALDRGSRCTADFSVADHLALPTSPSTTCAPASVSPLLVGPSGEPA